MTTDLTMPEPNRTIVDAACADDAEYFRTFPGATYRERPYQIGELWPFDAATGDDPYAIRILVVQIAPGVRVRRVIGAGDTVTTLGRRQHD